jgi:hypothetical protein
VVEKQVKKQHERKLRKDQKDQKAAEKKAAHDARIAARAEEEAWCVSDSSWS